MQIPDEMRKCVAFLACNTVQGLKLGGTVFFIGIPIPDTTRNFICAVTAKHVIDKIRKYTTDQKVYFRLNFVNADAGYVSSELSDWRFHPTDKAVDVAVLHIGFNEQVDHMLYPIESFATEEIIDRERISLGDEVFLTGLFVHHSGTKRNIPIIRVGNIAAMPEEPVNTEFSPRMEAYLVEARSIGGLSGSPVFVVVGGIRTLRDGSSAMSLGSKYHLLGLMHGHWDLPVSDTDANTLDSSAKDSVNMGIAIVVPAKKILEVINQSELEERRKKGEAEIKKQSAATADSAVGKEQAEPFTKEHFERALKKVGRPDEPSQRDGERNQA